MVQEIPFASVVIVNHNGIDFVDACLRSVLKSDYANFEVIFVDNASCDGSLQYVKSNFSSNPRMRIIENAGSFGPAVGRNKGIAVAKGKYIAFLDNDTEVDACWLKELVRVLESDFTVGAAQSKLLNIRERKRFDCAGDYLGPLGFLIERSKGAEDKGQFDSVADILSAKSAASIIRKDIFVKIGGFDEDYYMYLEETDLSWRVWLSGNRVVFIPSSVVYHAFNTPKKDMKKYYDRSIVRYYGCRNYISTLVKNLEFGSLVKIMPLHIFAWTAIAFLFMLKGQVTDFFYITKGIIWNIANAGILIRKRMVINRNIRVVRDSAIFKKIKSSEGLGDYFRKISTYLNARLA